MKLPLALILSILATSVCVGGTFLDDYESAAAGTKLPEGYTSFGSFGQSGVSNAKGDAASGSMGGYIEIDFAKTAWGAGFAHYGLDLDLTGAELSVEIKASNDLSGKEAVVGFRISDADGTVVRTPLTALFAPKSSFVKFAQPVKDLITVDEPGNTPGIDLKHVTSIGLLFYKREDNTASTRFAFDNLGANRAK